MNGGFSMGKIRKYETMDVRFFIEPGWENLIEAFLTKFEVINKNNYFILKQVKQKFGGLRICFEIKPKYGYDLPSMSKDLKVNYMRLLNEITNTELEASRTCEFCGCQDDTVKKIEYHNWIYNSCNECVI